jgi:soluble lytic murein transglycosylase-like protein
MTMDISGIQARISSIQARIDQMDATTDPSQNQFRNTLAMAQAPSVPSESSLTAPDGDTVRPLNPGDLNITQASPLSPEQLDPIVSTAAQKYGVDPLLVKAVIQTESGGNPTAVSRSGALGLMQLMPSNIADSKVQDPFDPAQNVDAGVSQLSGYLKKYNGNLDSALAAYNAGPGAVEQFHGVPPYRETQQYIKKIRGLLVAGGAPD